MKNLKIKENACGVAGTLQVIKLISYVCVNMD